MGLSITSDLQRLLPGGGQLARAVEALEQVGLSDVVLVEVDGTGVEAGTLDLAVDALAEVLAQEPFVARVQHRVDSEVLSLPPLLASRAIALLPGDLVAERLQPDALQETLTRQRNLLASPMGVMLGGRIEADPLGLGLEVARRLGDSALPFSVDASRGRLLDSSGTRAILVVQASRSGLDVGPDDPDIASFEAAIKNCTLPATWFGGPRIAVTGARILRDGVGTAARWGTGALLLLFLVGFRSLRPLFGGVLPLGVAVAATLATATWLGPVHGISMGFCVALFGLAVDYWIHLYVAAVAAPQGVGFAGRLSAAEGAARRLAPALALAAGSTVGACLLLATSEFPVVSDLGWMGAAASGSALLATLGLGPVSYAVFGGRPLVSWGRGRPGRWVPGGVLAVTAFLLAISIPVSTLDGDPRNLLPLPQDLRSLEWELNQRYGGMGTGGLVVIRGKTTGEALDGADKVEAALGGMAGVQLQGASAVQPGPALQQSRMAQLPGREELSKRLFEAAARTGFSEEWAAKALEQLSPARGTVLPRDWVGTPLEALVGRHVHEGEDGTGEVVLSVVVEDDALAREVEATIKEAVPHAMLLFPSRFAAAGVESIVAELVRLGGWAIPGILLLLLFRFGFNRALLAAALPPAGAIAWSLGLHAWLGMPWNVVSACAMVLLLGLGLDYGILMAEAARRKENDSTNLGILMSAATTMAGFGLLATSDSAALAGLGIGVLGGLVGAVLCALWVVPAWVQGEPLYSPAWKRRGAMAAGVMVLAWHADLALRQLTYMSPPERVGEVPTHTLVQHGDRDLQFGPNRLRYSQGIWAMRLTGSPYEMGYANGMLGRDLQDALEAQALEAFHTAVPNPLARFAILRGLAGWMPGLDRFFTPAQLQEVSGSVDAGRDTFKELGPAFTRRIYYHAIHDLGQALVDTPLVVGCSGFMAGGDATADGSWLLARNFDFDGGVVFDRDKIVTFVVPEEGISFVSVSFTGMVGVVSGMNADGLAVAIQAAGSEASIRPGMPMALVVREMLQHASSLEEAEAILRKRAGTVSENVMVVDGEAGEAALFEVTPETVERLEVGTRLGVTNHFRTMALASDLTNQERVADYTTRHRLARIDELLKRHHGGLDPTLAREILEDRNGVGDTLLPPGHRWALNADIATHGVVFDATHKRIWVSRYPNLAGGWVSFDLENALAGDLEPRDAIAAGDLSSAFAVRRGRRFLRDAREARGAEAESLARRGVALMPTHPEALGTLAHVLAGVGKELEAAQAAELALAGNPEYGDQRRALDALLEKLR
jgi:predicted exporter